MLLYGHSKPVRMYVHIISPFSVPGYFPPSLTTLSLAENHVQDLNEVSGVNQETECTILHIYILICMHVYKVYVLQINATGMYVCITYVYHTSFTKGVLCTCVCLCCYIINVLQVSFLSVLPQLSEVSVMGNPCVSLAHHPT